MPKILVLNNYPLETVWDEVRRGEKPDHHLYGINHLQAAGYQVEIVPFQPSKTSRWGGRANKWLAKSRFPIPLGDIDQQMYVLRRARRGDIIYAPCQTQTQLLCYLRAAGLFRHPIVNLAHHPFERGRLAALRRPLMRAFVRGTDAFPALSRNVARQVSALSRKTPSRALRWGPDASYYPSQPTRGRGVVAAGRTGRDFLTFGRAASQTSSPARIICLNYEARSAWDFGPNVQVSVEPAEGYMKYPELLGLYAQARALAVPLLPGLGLSGLTSLVDALGMGKPVIMTRHPLIDLDIEAEGVGKWVEPGDVEGWRAAIQFFEDNEDEALHMGKRARALVDAGLNSASFAKAMTDVFDRVARAR